MDDHSVRVAKNGFLILQFESSNTGSSSGYRTWRSVAAVPRSRPSSSSSCRNLRLRWPRNLSDAGETSSGTKPTSWRLSTGVKKVPRHVSGVDLGSVIYALNFLRVQFIANAPRFGMKIGQRLTFGRIWTLIVWSQVNYSTPWAGHCLMMIYPVVGNTNTNGIDIKVNRVRLDTQERECKCKLH